MTTAHVETAACPDPHCRHLEYALKYPYMGKLTRLVRQASGNGYPATSQGFSAGDILPAIHLAEKHPEFPPGG